MVAFLNYQNNKKDIITQDQDSTYRFINKPINDTKCDHYSKRYQSL